MKTSQVPTPTPVFAPHLHCAPCGDSWLRRDPSESSRKRTCNSIPAIVGPWRAAMRAWHAPNLRLPVDACRGSAGRESENETKPLGLALTIPEHRLRQALRRERVLGQSGHAAYSIERHDRLSHAVKR